MGSGSSKSAAAAPVAEQDTSKDQEILKLRSELKQQAEELEKQKIALETASETNKMTVTELHVEKPAPTPRETTLGSELVALKKTVEENKVLIDEQKKQIETLEQQSKTGAAKKESHAECTTRLRTYIDLTQNQGKRIEELEAEIKAMKDQAAADLAAKNAPVADYILEYDEFAAETSVVDKRKSQ